MSEESLGGIFYVSSKGEVYAPIPHDHSLIPYTSRRHIFPIGPKPAMFQITFLPDNLPMSVKIEMFRVCFNRTSGDAMKDRQTLDSRGRVSFGGLTLESAEAKAEDILKFLASRDCYADFILEKVI